MVDLKLLTATDTELWQRGIATNLIIFTKGVDFYDRAPLFGAPPQVAHVAVGNCSNSRLFDILESEWSRIDLALASGARLISITQEKIDIFS